MAGIPTSTLRQRERAANRRRIRGRARRVIVSRRSCTPMRCATPAWGHRKIWALTVADGHQVSMRTVHRILDERGLHGRRYQRLYNDERPDETIGWARPRDRYTQAPA
jgi:hypothetical protein